MLTSSKHVFGQHLLFNGRIGMKEGKYWLSGSSENVAFQTRFSTFFQEIGRNLVSNFVLPIGKCGGKPQVLTFNGVVRSWGEEEEKLGYPEESVSRWPRWGGGREGHPNNPIPHYPPPSFTVGKSACDLFGRCWLVFWNKKSFPSLILPKFLESSGGCKI